MSASTEQAALLRAQFFGFLYGDDASGYVCIAVADKTKANFRERYFKWPDERDGLVTYLGSVADNRNVWFCVSLLSGQERKKPYCQPSTFAWAEWDHALPGDLEPKPSVLVESSPGKYHAYWRIEGAAVPADVAEDFSRRIAYKFDADKSGWDMTQLLRVPFTKNFKYDPPVDVKIIDINSDPIPVSVLDAIEPPTGASQNGSGVVLLEPMPDPEKLPTSENVLYRYRAEGKLTETFVGLYTQTPDESSDWSRILWRFIKLCLEMGMTREEAFVVCLTAECNKYSRDNRPVQYLWRDIIKAHTEMNRYEILVGGKVEIIRMPQLVDPDEVEEDALIKDYKTWAAQATDAPEQYHELSIFIALSALICAGLYIKVEWGEMAPNLWGLILGESTLTRKTTAMRLATDMLNDIDPELIVASHASPEGLFSALSHRPQRVSVFYKDEVSELFSSINHKDYMAGLQEAFTQLYDVPKVLSRVLRKETITISEPYFIFFGGGIRDEVYSLLNDRYITSGFLPRFLIVSGENDLSRIRRTGPPSQISTERKDRILQSLADLRERYNISVPVTIAGQTVDMTSRIEAKLTDGAWEIFWDIEEKLTLAGANSDVAAVALPMFTRLGFSALKMSLLIAASRRSPTSANQLIVEASDIKQAAFYVQKWGHYSVDLLLNAGKTTTEKMIDRSLTCIRRKEGMTKSEFMQRLHLSAKDAKELIETLVQRGLIDLKKHGNGHRLFTI